MLTASSLQKEVELLKSDAGLIRQFASTNSVRVDGKLYSSRCVFLDALRYNCTNTLCLQHFMCA